MPIDLDESVAALASGRPKAVDLGEVNGITFVNHVSLGLHPRVIRLRETAGYTSRLGKLASDVKAWLRAARRRGRSTYPPAPATGRCTGGCPLR